jgi:hypothetical protein
MKIAVVAAIASIALGALGASIAMAAEPTLDELKQKFQETLGQSRTTVEVKGGKLAGPGAEVLRARIAASHFVLIGEEHGVATIADTVRAMLPDLTQSGYRHFAIETDPYIAAKLETMLRAGGTKEVAKFLALDGNKFAIPFYNWSAEAALADAAVKANANSKPALWGLDQVFIGASAALLNDVAAQASSAEAKALAAALAGKAKGNLEFMGKVDLAELQQLRAALGAAQDRPLAQLIDDMILSARIYQPFVSVTTGLSVYAANLERETLMKRTFLNLYRAAGGPKVFFKFGGSHMMRGLATTHVPSLTSFVSELALSEGKSAFNLLILCGPGTKAGDLMGNEAACSMDVAKDWPDLVGQVDAKQMTLFDLKPWKDRPGRWKHLPEETRRMIWAFDAALFVPNGKPAAPLK